MEYTGQQRHMVYLAPMWKWVLDTDLHADGRSTPVKEILAGKSFSQPLGGMAESAATAGWPHHWRWPTFMPSVDWRGTRISIPAKSHRSGSSKPSAPITGSSTRLPICCGSPPAYENYTGLAWPADPHRHHPAPTTAPILETSERTGASGTMPIAVALAATAVWQPAQATPANTRRNWPNSTKPRHHDDLLLFFHHVPYTYKTHDGRTVIQYIYDTAITVAQRRGLWTS